MRNVPRLPAHRRNAAVLTPRQREVLDFIRAHVAQHGKSPTRVEIADGVNANSGAVSQLLYALEARGLVDLAFGIKVLVEAERSASPADADPQSLPAGDVEAGR